MTSEVDLQAAILKYEEPVMYLVLKDNTELNSNNLQEIAQKAGELSAGKPFLLFSDARVNLDITPDGHKAAASDRSLMALVGASAVLVSSWPKKFITNLFIRNTTMPFPVKFFTNASKALDWLKLQKTII